jgi:hypothetical protein
MASLESVQQKMYRARHHYEDLVDELRKYFLNPPGEIVESEDSNPQDPRGEFRARESMPARFGLIFGDCLQCLRSSLDYLIWELVLAANKQPGRHNQFPIALTSNAYDELKKRDRLKGVDPKAVALIDALQPFNLPNPKESPFAVLDDLTNINKHRRVILTNLVGTPTKPPFPFPHFEGKVHVDDGSGTFRETPFWAFVVLHEGVAKTMEVTICLDSLARHIADTTLPPFKQFFE